MCHGLLLFMGNAMLGGGGGRKTTEPTRSDALDSKTAVAMDELTRDVERLKAAMDDKDRKIERLVRTVDEVRVSRRFFSQDFSFPVLLGRRARARYRVR